MNIYLSLTICGIIGILFADIRKIISIRRKGNTINYNYSIADYLKMDWDVIISQLLCVIAGLIVWKLFSDKNWYKYGELIFILIGGIGSELMNTFMSKAEKDIIDKIKNYNDKN